MTDTTIIEEIKSFKSQLDQYLGKKFTDPTILLGLNNVIQSKFENWIIADFNQYYELIQENTNGKIEFNTIKYFETLWSNFHYPIIKFFTNSHAVIYNEVLTKFNNAKDNFKLKPVEIRKINDMFIKFIKVVHSFYINLLNYFSTHFNNPLLPDIFLNHFNFIIPKNSIKTFNSNLQANLLYLIHKTLLCLGDCSRHRSFIETSYVLPMLNIKNFHRFRLLSSPSSSANFKKIETLKPYYDNSLRFYRLCITLLPSLNEPYNHIGMIHNLIDDKFDAIYWFLRSNFTRIPSNKLSINNLNNLLGKNWFKTKLYETLIEENINNFNQNYKNNLFAKSFNLNIILINLIGYYYLPNNYRINKSHIMKKLNYNKVEFIFLNLNFNDEIFLQLMDHNLNDDGLFHYLKQLIVIIGFYRLIPPNLNFKKFIIKYLDFFFKSIILIENITTNKVPKSSQNILICLRLLLTWFKEDNFKLNNQILITSLIEIFNKFINELDQKLINPDESISQESKYLELIDTLNNISSRPIRNYYFKEDVLLKDFSLIKYQFKDFKDEHLFESNDINLLNNDYRSLIVNDFPTFLDNDIFLKLNNDKVDQNVIDSEIIKLENYLRVQAVLIMGKKILMDCPGKVEFKDRFVMTATVKKRRSRRRQPSRSVLKEKKNVVTERTSGESEDQAVDQSEESMDENVSGQEDDDDEGEDEEEDDEEEYDDDDDDDSSIDEIQNFILNHSNQLQNQMKSQIWNGNAGEVLMESKNPEDPKLTQQITLPSQQHPIRLPSQEPFQPKSSFTTHGSSPMSTAVVSPPGNIQAANDNKSQVPENNLSQVTPQVNETIQTNQVPESSQSSNQPIIQVENSTETNQPTNSQSYIQINSDSSKINKTFSNYASYGNFPANYQMLPNPNYQINSLPLPSTNHQPPHFFSQPNQTQVPQTPVQNMLPNQFMFNPYQFQAGSTPFSYQSPSQDQLPQQMYANQVPMHPQNNFAPPPTNPTPTQMPPPGSFLPSPSPGPLNSQFSHSQSPNPTQIPPGSQSNVPNHFAQFYQSQHYPLNSSQSNSQ